MTQKFVLLWPNSFWLASKCTWKTFHTPGRKFLSKPAVGFMRFFALSIIITNVSDRPPIDAWSLHWRTSPFILLPLPWGHSFVTWETKTITSTWSQTKKKRSIGKKICKSNDMKTIWNMISAVPRDKRVMAGFRIRLQKTVLLQRRWLQATSDRKIASLFAIHTRAAIHRAVTVLRLTPSSTVWILRKKL